MGGDPSAADARPPAMGGIRAPTLAALLRAAGSGPMLAVDLTLGAWRGHEAARQLSAQLGCTPPPPVRSRPPASTEPGTGPERMLGAYGAAISAGIDAESRGMTAALTARLMFAWVLPALTALRDPTVAVLLPRDGHGWEPEDVEFIDDLARHLRARGGRVLLAHTGDTEPVLPSRWRVAWHPDPHTAEQGAERGEGAVRHRRASAAPEDLGPWTLVPAVIEPAVAARLRQEPDHGNATAAMGERAVPPELPELPGGCRLVPPELRPPEVGGRAVYDRLGAATDGWLRAYAQVHGNNLFRDPWLLAARAWESFTEGGGGVALRLLEHAVAGAQDALSRGALRAQLAALRIALSRYAEAAAAADPSPALPAELRGFLLQAKGWGLAMAAEPASARAAEPYLAEARQLLGGVVAEREHLYLLNISALAQLKSGAPDSALALERRIETDAARLTPRDFALEYVNAINLARLRRRLGDWDEADRCYRRAFATVEGIRSDSDAVHASVCRARLADDAGWSEEGFAAWLRAALWWVSSPVPEGLAGRVASAITGRREQGGADAVEPVATALAARLRASRPLDDAVGEPGWDAPSFTRMRDLPGAWDWAAVGGGWSIVGGDGDGPDPVASAGIVPTGPAWRELRVLLRGILARLCPAPELPASRLLAVDDRFGREMPTCPPELAARCVRSGIRRLYADGCRVDLDDPRTERLLRGLRVHRGPAVARVEPANTGALVRFRRYLPPRRLDPVDARLLAAADDGPALAVLAGRVVGGNLCALLKRIDVLEETRVICLDLPEEEWTKAGISSPTNGSFAAI